MSAPSISFSSEIRRVAETLGRVPTSHEVTELEDELRSLAVLDAEAGTVTVNAGDGKSINVAAYIASRTGTFAQLAGENTAPASEMIEVKIGNSTMMRRSDDPFLKIIRSIDAGREEAILAEIKTWPNPFAEKTWNRTRQVLMNNKMPVLAAKMKAQAGR